MNEHIQMSIENRGVFFDLSDQLENNSNVHRRLVDEIETLTGRNLICYMANLQHPASLMQEPDSNIIENLLRSIDLSKYDGKLDLLIHSPGGRPEEARAIVRVCKAYSASFRVIVPGVAMSAATLVAMGANKIAMSKTSCLGPIDPQMAQQIGPNQVIMRPAQAYIRAFVQLIQAANAGAAKGQPIHAFLHLLNRQDPTWIEVCQNAHNATKLVAIELLRADMLKDKNDTEIENIVNHFLKIGDEYSHGYTIPSDMAKSFGLNIDEINNSSDIWNKIWELYTRIQKYSGEKMLAKYFLCNKGGLDMVTKAVPIG